MLVLSRKLGESVVINDLIITVDSFTADHSVLSLMRTNCEFLQKVTAPFHKTVEITDHVRAVMIQAEPHRVRLGFHLPPDYSIARWEVWDPQKGW
jgi:sRNA-binding carbon storage regulator CsrA